MSERRRDIESRYQVTDSEARFESASSRLAVCAAVERKSRQVLRVCGVFGSPLPGRALVVSAASSPCRVAGQRRRHCGNVFFCLSSLGELSFMG